MVLTDICKGHKRTKTSHPCEVLVFSNIINYHINQTKSIMKRIV